MIDETKAMTYCKSGIQFSNLVMRSMMPYDIAFLGRDFRIIRRNGRYTSVTPFV